MVEPTITITLDRTLAVRGPFGLPRAGRALALTIDEPERFVAALATQG